MGAEPPRESQPRPPRYQPLGWLIVLLVIALIAAVVGARFLVAPIAVLLVFYLGFSALDRRRRR